MSKWYRSELLS